MTRPIHDRLVTAEVLLRKIADRSGRLTQADRIDARDAASAVRAVSEPGGWTLLRSHQSEGGDTTNMPLSMSEDLRDALVDAGEEFGVVLSRVATEGLRKAVASDWTPPKNPTRRRAQRGRTVVLNVRVDSDLLAQAGEAALRLSEEAGYRVTKSSIAISWMAEELGVDRGAGHKMQLVMPKALVDHFLEAERAGADLEQILDEGLKKVLSGNLKPAKPRRWGSADGPAVERARITVRIDDALRQQLHEQVPDLSKVLGYWASPGVMARAVLVYRLGEPAE